MDLENDFFGAFGTTGLSGALFVVLGVVMIVYGYVSVEEGKTVVGQISRIFNPEAAAAYQDALYILFAGAGLSVFGGLLVVFDYLGDDDQ